MRSHAIAEDSRFIWRDCAEESCSHILHLDMPTEQINSLPQSWVNSLIGNYIPVADLIICFNSAGRWHSDEGPAMEDFGANLIEWYRNGLLHRVGGPARTDRIGRFQEWWENGKCHRVGGPAVIIGNIEEEWENGVRISPGNKLPGRKIRVNPKVVPPKTLEKWMR